MIEQEFHRTFPSDRFAALAVHVGKGTRFAHQAYLEAGVTYATLYDLEGRFFEDFVPRAQDAPPFPLHMVLDRAGQVAAVLGEIVTPEQIAAATEQLESLLAP